MSVILKNSVFLHIPKTGGVWVRRMLNKQDLEVKEIRSRGGNESSEGSANSWHTVPTWDKDYRARPYRFCFVRNPLTWHKSYWSFRASKNNWNPVNVFDTRCKSGTFHEYISKVLYYYPDGYLSWLYEYYTSHCVYVGKVEFLAESLIVALDGAEEPYSTEDIVNNRYVYDNRSPSKYKAQAEYTRWQIKAIQEQEQEIFDKYEYAMPHM